MATRVWPVGEALVHQHSQLSYNKAPNGHHYAHHNYKHPQARANSGSSHANTNISTNPSPSHSANRSLQRAPINRPLSSPTLRPTPASRISSSRMSNSRLEPVLEGDHRLLRDVRAPPPGDVTRMRRTPSRPEVAKQRSMYFEDAFVSKDRDYAGDGIRNEAIVLVEVKTNVVVNDEFNFITQLCSHLSVRYNRPVESMVVTVQHSVCMLFSGTFDPAYTITIKALPYLIQAATNRRNAALLQRHMENALRVPPERGLVQFNAIPEDCSGWNGTTVAGEISRVSGRDEHHGSGAKKRSSVKAAATSRVHTPTMTLSRGNNNDDGASLSRKSKDTDASTVSPDDGSKKKLSSKKSFMQNLWFRSSRTIADDDSTRGQV